MPYYNVKVTLYPSTTVPPTPEDACYYKHMSVYCKYSFTDDKRLKDGVIIGHISQPRQAYKGEIKLKSSGNGYVIPAKIDSDVYVPFV